MRNTLIASILALLLSPFCQAQQESSDIRQDEKIPELLELKKTLEKENKLSNEFTVQLFYGDLKSAEEVMDDYKKFYTTWPASLEYETPNYKVWVGSFGNRLDADRALLKLKEKFPSAFILRPNIQ
ncbi:hypothetical protein BST85_09885 [Aureitalea marina]|uniref:SPOR domain-containing protein n=2 Tax=Aureitalea marina TaxID=930804 RepID=A0A2S7KU39_9FLAO|nr:hypothetical protein BST85_09885 [Aureitalea marina]